MYIYSSDTAVDSALKSSFFETSRNVVGKVEVINKDGSVYQTLYGEDHLKSIEIERSIQAQDSLTGCAISKKYVIRVIDTAKEISAVPSSDIFSTKRLKPYIGIRIGNASPYYAPFPEAMIYETSYDASSKIYTFTCYDDMQKFNSLVLRDLAHEKEIVSLRTYLSYICQLAGISLSTNTFFNENMQIAINSWDENREASSSLEPNFSGDEYLREVICKICEACLCNAIINRQGELELVSVVKAFDETKDLLLNPDKYYSYTKAEVFGPINTVVLSREGEDNVYYPNINERGSVYITENTVSEHIAQNGLWELKLTDNPILDRGIGSADDRATSAQNIFNHVKNMSYYAYSLEFRGAPYVDEGDRILLEDLSGNTIETTYFSDKLVFDGALKCTSEGNIISQTQTEYDKAVSLKETLRTTQLKVDKNEGLISSLVGDVRAMEGKYISQVALSSAINQTSEEINATISRLGGNNLIKNSAFYNGTQDWNFSESASVKGPIFDDVADNNTLSMSRFILIDGKMSTAFQTIIDEYYTVSFLMLNKATLDEKTTYARVVLNNTTFEEIESSKNAYTQWTTIDHTFRAISNETSIEFFTDNGNEDLQLADIRVVPGTVSQQWTQHKTELYGKGVLIDNTGITVKGIGAESQNTTVAIDNDSLVINDGENDLTRISDEEIYSQKSKVCSQISLGDSIAFVKIDDKRFFITKGV